MNFTGKNFITISIVLFITACLTYVNILPNKLFFDDEELIYRNTYVADLKYFPQYFTENMVAGAGKTSNMYRPVLLTSFAIDHLLWGNNPLGYHLTSIILHAANSILVYILLLLLFGSHITAFPAALLFVLHPLQSEAVIYASGRTDPLYSFFFLLSVISFIRYLTKNNGSRVLYFLSLTFYLLSLLSKETAFMLPFLLIIVSVHLKNINKTGFRKLLLLLMPYIVVNTVYFILRLTLLNFSNTLNFYMQQNMYSQHLSVRLLTFAGVFWEYLYLYIFPKNLIIARNAEIITTVFHWKVIGFLLLIAVPGFIIYKIFPKGKTVLFAYFWFFILILPVSGIIPINNIVAEHYLYLPSLSFFALAGLAINAILDKEKNGNVRIPVIVAFTILLMLLAGRTFRRTFDFRDAITFYTVSLKQTPGHVPMMHNLAMAYGEKGDYQEAINLYLSIISQSDTYPNTHHNLANIYKNLGKFEKAEEEYKKALDMDPHFNFSYIGLADLYEKTGEMKKRENVLNIVNSINKQHISL